MPPAINRGPQSIFSKNKRQTGSPWPEKHSLAGTVSHPSSVTVPGPLRWLAGLGRRLEVRHSEEYPRQSPRCYLGHLGHLRACGHPLYTLPAISLHHTSDLVPETHSVNKEKWRQHNSPQLSDFEPQMKGECLGCKTRGGRHEVCFQRERKRAGSETGHGCLLDLDRKA